MPKPKPHDETLDVRVIEIVRALDPDGYCDACLALFLGVPLQAARDAAVRVGAAPVFDRKTRDCYRCGRKNELTCAR